MEGDSEEKTWDKEHQSIREASLLIGKISVGC